MSLAGNANRYHYAGLSVVPTDLKEKKPIFNGKLIRWKQYQTSQPSLDQIRFWFGASGDTPSAEAMAIVCGKVSGNLEMIDFDAKAALYGPWVTLLEGKCPGLLARLLIERTQSGGLHVVYRCPQAAIPGNQKLAMYRHAVAEDAIVLVVDRPHAVVGGKRFAVKKDSNGYYVPLTMIETRGQGGYFLCAPSAGYTLEQGSYEELPVITAEERESIIACARSLNQFVEESKVQTGVPKKREEGDGLRPGDDFNERGDVDELLLKHGWQPYVGHTWTRPGKATGASASLLDGKVFYVFSTSVTEFQAERGYSPFAVYAILEHGGDFSATGRALYQQGYGDRAPAGGFSKDEFSEEPLEHSVNAKNSVPDWRPPMPLERHANVPEFPVRIFPKSLSRYCYAVAEAAECPPDLIAQTMLGAVSATMLGKAEADWGKREPLALYLLTAAAPSEHKSTVEHEVLRPLREAEKFALDAAKPIIEKAKHEREILEAKLDQAKKDAAKDSRKDGLVAELIEELRTFVVPVEPRLTIEDVTPETLATKLMQHQALAIFSSEGSVIDNLTNRYSSSRSPNYKLYLKAWSGDPHIVDRQNRTERLERPLLVISVMVQPAAFDEILMHVEGARSLGLLSRFLFAVPKTLVGTRTLDIPRVDNALTSSWAASLHRLHQLPSGVIRLSGEAIALQTDIARILERRLGPGGDLDHISDWVGKVQRGQSSRLACLLHCLENADPYTTEVSAATMQRSIALCQYYLGHAQRAFEMLTPRPEGLDMNIARRMVAFLAGKKTVTNAELTRRFGLRKAELSPYLELLEELGYLLRDPTRKGSYHVNPERPVDSRTEVGLHFEQPEDVAAVPAACNPTTNGHSPKIAPNSSRKTSTGTWLNETPNTTEIFQMPSNADLLDDVAPRLQEVTLKECFRDKADEWNF